MNALQPRQVAFVVGDVRFSRLQDGFDNAGPVDQLFVVVRVAGVRQPKVTLRDDPTQPVEVGVVAQPEAGLEVLNQILAERA